MLTFHEISFCGRHDGRTEKTKKEETSQHRVVGARILGGGLVSQMPTDVPQLPRVDEDA